MDTRSELIRAVDKIASIREYYGVVVGVREMGDWLMSKATEKFQDGDIESATIYRNASKMLYEKSEELFYEYRNLEDVVQYWEIIERYSTIAGDNKNYEQ